MIDQQNVPVLRGTPIDRYYLEQAYSAALKSPDPNTQNGAVIPHDATTYSIFLTACNTVPAGVAELPGRMVPPTKYTFIEHAERGVIFEAAAKGMSTVGKTLYCPWYACADCARAIICSGISRVVGHKRMFDDTPDRWKETMVDALTMFREANVEAVLLDGSIPASAIRFDGVLWDP